MKYKQYCPEVISSTTISFKTKQFCQVLNKYYFLCWACSPFLVSKAQVSCTAILACAQPLSGRLFPGCSRVTSSLSCHFSIVILGGPFKGTQVQHFSALSHTLGASLSHTWLGYCWLIKLILVQTRSIPQRAHTQGSLTAGGTICGGSEMLGRGGWMHEPGHWKCVLGDYFMSRELFYHLPTIRWKSTWLTRSWHHESSRTQQAIKSLSESFIL